MFGVPMHTPQCQPAPTSEVAILLVPPTHRHETPAASPLLQRNPLPPVGTRQSAAGSRALRQPGHTTSTPPLPPASRRATQHAHVERLGTGRPRSPTNVQTKLSTFISPPIHTCMFASMKQPRSGPCQETRDEVHRPSPAPPRSAICRPKPSQTVFIATILLIVTIRDRHLSSQSPVPTGDCAHKVIDTPPTCRCVHCPTHPCRR